MSSKRLLFPLCLLLPFVAACSSSGSSGSQSTATQSSASIPSVVECGSYPQTIVSDSDIISYLKHVEVGEDGYYHYEGERYISVSSNPNPESVGAKFSDGTTLAKNQVYWFHVEPIKWKVLSSENGEALLVSEKILEARYYAEGYDKQSEEGFYANNYKNSDIRGWLGGKFYPKAFSDTDKERILKTIVDNATDNKYACENTQDNVFLLSRSEILDTNHFAAQSDRIAQVSDYAMCRGVYAAPNTGGGWWWTRTPAPADRKAYGVSYLGEFGFREVEIDVSTRGVRPAVRIHL